MSIQVWRVCVWVGGWVECLWVGVSQKDRYMWVESSGGGCRTRVKQ